MCNILYLLFDGNTSILITNIHKRANEKVFNLQVSRESSQEKGLNNNDDLGKELCSFYRWRGFVTNHMLVKKLELEISRKF